MLVRVLIEDDERQSEVARRAWHSAVGAGGIFLPIITLVETVWVLRARAKLERHIIVGALRSLLDQDGVVIEHDADVRAAIDAYEAGTADFSDYVIRERARTAGAIPVLTFDANFARDEHVELLPIS